MRDPDHEEIVSECEGCIRILKHYRGDRFICACHPFPKIKWLGGFVCEDSTHIEKDDKGYPIKKP